MRIIYSTLIFLGVNAQTLFSAEQPLENQPITQQVVVDEADRLIGLFDVDQTSQKICDEKAKIVVTLKNLPQESLIGLSEHVRMLVNGFHRLFPSMDIRSFSDPDNVLSGYDYFLETFAKIAANQRDNCISNIIEFFDRSIFYEGRSSSYYSYFHFIRECIANVSVVLRNPHIFEYVNEIMDGGHYRWAQTKLTILSRFVRLSERINNDVQMGNLARYIARSLPLMLQNEAEQQSEYDRSIFCNKIINHINLLASILQHHHFNLFEPLITIKSSCKLDIMKEIFDCVRIQHSVEGFFMYILPEDQEAFIQDAVRIFSLNIEGENQYTEIINRLSKISGWERRNLIERFFEREQKQTYTSEEILDHFECAIFRGRDRHWLDLEGRQVRGVDIHSGDRETKTSRSLSMLIRYQGHMSTEMMRGLYEECKNYIGEGNFTKNQKERALIALEGSGSTHSWANLFSQEPSVLFANLDGLSIIARLWHFANTFIDENIPGETENARRSFVLACVDSAFSDGDMICNSGKVQRIVCAVLQGRLPGVEVDPLPTLTGKDLARNYLQTLQGVPITDQSDDVFLSAAAAWLLEQGVTLTEEEKTAFMDDIISFYHLSR
ncbi:MAG: hypothetical protein FADNKDHG_01204 [Holosporales bacterium]